MEKPRIVDLIDITQEELNAIKKEIPFDEVVTLYSDPKLKISLLRTKRKTYDIISTYGDTPFIEIVKEWVKINNNCN